MANFTYKKYTQSNDVTKAKNALDAQLANTPGAYNSAYTTQLNDTLDKINNREAFSYDPNADPMYQMYKDAYVQGGKLASANAVGQAAALTDGYGNSYATTASNQAYQQYLTGLNDRMIDLAQMASDRYDKEGEELRNMYAILADREGTDYSRYRDTVGDYQTELARLTDAYNNERQWDYGLYSDDYSRAYDNFRSNIADEQNARDYAEKVRQYNESLALDKAKQAEAVRQYNESLALDKAKQAEAVRQYNESLAAKSSSSSSDGSKSSAKTLTAAKKETIRNKLQTYASKGDTSGAAQYMKDLSVEGYADSDLDPIWDEIFNYLNQGHGTPTSNATTRNPIQAIATKPTASAHR